MVVLYLLYSCCCVGVCVLSLPHGAMGWSVIVASPGLEVIKLEFILKLKIKSNDWLLAANIELNFGFETLLKFYNLGAWSNSLVFCSIQL